jgi:hypothetical protein
MRRVGRAVRPYGPNNKSQYQPEATSTEKGGHTSRRAMMKLVSPWQGLGQEVGDAMSHDATHVEEG